MIDYLLFNFLNGLALRHSWSDTVFVFLAKYLPYLLAVILILFLLKNFKKYWRMVFLSFLSAGLAEIIVQIFHWFWHRPRPFAAGQVNLLLGHSASSSFPSGHTSFFFALSTIVYFYNKKAGLFFYIASLLIGISRVVSGVHWPSDILAGIILGILCGYLVFSVSRKK